MKATSVLLLAFVAAAFLVQSCTNPVNPPATPKPADATPTATAINLSAIMGIPAPVTGTAPVTTITETAQYSGTVSWSQAPATFAANTVYRATIVLTAKAGFTFWGVEPDFYTLEGSARITNQANSGEITAEFRATGDADYVSGKIGTLKLVPAGGFQRDADPANVSIITRPYRISQYEITREQFKGVMGIDPSTVAYSSGTSDPVQATNWYHAIAFCNKLSLSEGLTPVYAVAGVDFANLAYASIPTGFNATWNGATADWTHNGYRLPTEMEWMWAAMGAPGDGHGTGINISGYLKAFAGSTGNNLITNYAVFGYGSGKVGATTTQRSNAVGSKTANELGLYDMSGNVSEWTWDSYDSLDTKYPKGTLSDYRGSSSNQVRFVRGGDWINNATNCTVAFRSYSYPNGNGYNFGFRVVRN